MNIHIRLPNMTRLFRLKNHLLLRYKSHLFIYLSSTTIFHAMLTVYGYPCCVLVSRNHSTSSVQDYCWLFHLITYLHLIVYFSPLQMATFPLVYSRIPQRGVPSHVILISCFRSSFDCLFQYGCWPFNTVIPH